MDRSAMRFPWFLAAAGLVHYALATLQAQPFANDTLRSTITVQGTVFCDRCRENRFTNNSLLLSGATVALDCKSTNASAPALKIEASTDEHGAFRLNLSYPASNSFKQLRGCKVELAKSPLKTCKHKTTSSKAFADALALKSKEGKHLVYSAGLLSYQPKSVPSFCTSPGGKRAHESERVVTSEAGSGTSDTVPDPAPMPFFPPLQVPAPGLPSFPTVPPLSSILPPMPPGFPGFPALPPFLPGASVPPLPSPQSPDLPDQPPADTKDPPAPSVLTGTSQR